MTVSAGHAPSARFNANMVLCEDLTPPEGPILTGVGFLDHMLDQFNSHAQIGVNVSITDFAGGAPENNNPMQNRNRHADHDQAKLVSLIGSKLGAEFHRLLLNSPTCGTSSRFACPLDEALVVCTLRRVAKGQGRLASFTLPPYGMFPAPAGRTRLGQLQLQHLETFWSNLAHHADLEISLLKVRGENAHHIVEACFKAAARALRNLLDGTDTIHLDDDSDPECHAKRDHLLTLYGPDSENYRQSVALKRTARVTRQTKETNISAKLNLNIGNHNTPTDAVRIDSGLAVLDEFLTTLFTAAGVRLELTCQDGDLWIDEHHTTEDIAISLGQALHQALGSKAGLNRMWCASAEQGDTKVEVVLDLSNRPMLTHNLTLDQTEMVGDFPVELLDHFLDSLVVNARMTCHIVQIHASDASSQSKGTKSKHPRNPLADTLLTVATALGTALKYCCMVDTRRAGATASSKGSLSV